MSIEWQTSIEAAHQKIAELETQAASDRDQLAQIVYWLDNLAQLVQDGATVTPEFMARVVDYLNWVKALLPANTQKKYDALWGGQSTENDDEADPEETVPGDPAG